MFNRKPDISDKMTVVMITRNRQQDLFRTLTNLQKLAYKVPIIVVDNNSADGTAQMVRTEFPDVRLVPLKRNQGALGRNVGAKLAATPYIAFCDDDSWWEGDALLKAIEYFEQYPKVGVITGRILVGDSRKLDPTSAVQSISPLEPTVEMPGVPVLGFLGCALIVRRETYFQAGGYSKHLYFSGEEELLAYDILSRGWGMTYCDDIVARHFPSTSRDLGSRFHLGARNKVLRAWLRRPLKQAIAKTLQPELDKRNWMAGLAGWMEGIATIPAIFAHRKVVPTWLEEQILQLEAQNEQLTQLADVKQRRHAAMMAASLATT